FNVDQLFAKGYYKQTNTSPTAPPFKLGVVYYDYPSFVRGVPVLQKQLANHGVSITDSVKITPAPNTAGVGDETAAIRNAAVKFKGEGITHVQFLATNNAFLQFTFMKNAQSQLYNPRYGLNSNDGGQALATLLGNDAGPQLKGALSTGW